jgi:hypothetical protein
MVSDAPSLVACPICGKTVFGPPEYSTPEAFKATCLTCTFQVSFGSVVNPQNMGDRRFQLTYKERSEADLPRGRGRGGAD